MDLAAKLRDVGIASPGLAAEKLARRKMVWAMMVKGERYKEPVALAA
jgi:hypothetical protein